MAPGFIVFVSLLVIAQFALPKRYGFLPLVLAGCHLGNVEILPELTTARLLILIGLGRAISGGFMVVPSGKSRLDVIFILFSFFAVFSTLGHSADAYVPSPFNARLGMVLNIMGSYLYGRTYIPDIASFRRYAFALPLVLIPLAISMTIEQRTQQNLYFALGAARAEAAVRADKVRAQGPFRHPILAGCAGATALPFAFLLWHFGRRKTAVIGFAACLGVVLACASSGPLAAVALAVAAIIIWYKRRLLRMAIWSMIGFALLFSLVSGQGPWHIMSRIDLVGGSTGWHRAFLIDQAIAHLGEWWFWGSDYTRHWMPFGVSFSPNHSDLTNYFIHLGVLGGLPLVLCLFAFIVTAFRMLARRLPDLVETDAVVLWCAGASLAAHAISFVSISYFDQMYIFFYLLLGTVPGLVSSGSETLAPSFSTPEPAEPDPVKPLRYYS